MAGDLLPNATVEQRVATGFHRKHTDAARKPETDREEFRVKQIVDRANTVGAVWLGLTVGCAQCHDHEVRSDYPAGVLSALRFLQWRQGGQYRGPAPRRNGPLPPCRNPNTRGADGSSWIRFLPSPCKPSGKPSCSRLPADSKVDLIWTLAWRKVGWLFDGGQEILRLDPSQRTQKQKDRLTDYFVRSYNHVVDQEHYEELGLKELNQELAKLRAEFPVPE